MASFNTTSYDKISGAYNMMSPIFIDGSNSIPMSGSQYYNGVFGNVMAGFCVDGLDSILGGNVIITGDVSCCSRLLVNGNTTFTTLPVCSNAPTTNFQLTNKSYVDNAISSFNGLNISNEIIGFNNITCTSISTNVIRT